MPANAVRRIRPQSAATLEADPTNEEIMQAVWSCDGSKALGYYGYNLSFIKEVWDIIGPSICDFVKKFMMQGILPNEVNTTWVALIPKVAGAKRLENFRPISMVGSLYKITSKLLSGRLKRVMGELVDETQSAFTNDRQILDGVLIANQTVEWMKRKKKDVVLLKLDFHKAYDTIKWSFLQQMGFGGRWMN